MELYKTMIVSCTDDDKSRSVIELNKKERDDLEVVGADLVDITIRQHGEKHALEEIGRLTLEYARLYEEFRKNEREGQLTVNQWKSDNRAVMTAHHFMVKNAIEYLEQVHD